MIVVAIYRQTDDLPDVEACTYLEVIGGPKRYCRIWDASPMLNTDWGWRRHPSAVEIWRSPDHPNTQT